MGPSNWKLRRRLAVLIATLLLAVLAAFSWMAYRELTRVLTQTAVARSRAVAQQISGLLETGVVGVRDETRRVAREAAIVAYASGAAADDAAARAAARSALEAAARGGALVVGLRLETPGAPPLELAGAAAGSSDSAAIEGGRAAAAAGGGAAAAAGAGAAARRASSVVPGIGPIEADESGARYTVVVPVGDSASGARLIASRRLSTVEGARRLGQLLGADMYLRLGNRDGGVWTDLTKRVPGPGAAELEAAAAGADAAATTTALAAIEAVPGTPWAVWTGMPRAAALAPARATLGRLSLVALLVLLAGVVAAFVSAGRMTRPLTALTSAAEGISRMDYSERVPVRGGDEVAVLGRAFNRMAEKVEASQRGLEEQVRHRTRELERALRELESTQDQLVANEKLAIIGQLASGVGHELRNPLGVMTNALYYLDARLTDVPSDVREYLDILRTQVTLSGRIVSDLLDFARVRDPERRAIAVEALVDSQLDPLGVHDGIRVERSFPDDLPAVLVDPVQVGQVVLNLLTNAVQAMDGEGTLRLSAERVSDEAIELRVADTGPGVAPEDADRIFEPLYTTKARGIGLGLAVSRRLIRANDGELTVATGEGGAGAEFRLRMPAHGKADA